MPIEIERKFTVNEIPKTITNSFVIEQFYMLIDKDFVQRLRIFDNKKAIATARVRQKEENILKIERVAVLFEFRRLKVGSTLIKNIIQYFTNLNENIFFILHSQVAVADFYESINFISYGDEFFEDGIPHIAMKYVKN